MKYSELISFSPIESTLQLIQSNSNKAEEINNIKTYVMSEGMAQSMKAPVIDQLQMDEVVDNKGVLTEEAGQFAGLDIMLSGGGFWIEMACAQFIINLRYALMSISLSQKADKSLSGIHRWLVGFGVTDEIFVMAMGI